MKYNKEWAVEAAKQGVQVWPFTATYKQGRLWTPPA